MYVIFILIYNFFTHGVILLLFINLTNTLYIPNNSHNCYENLNNSFYLKNSTSECNCYVNNIFNVFSTQDVYYNNFLLFSTKGSIPPDSSSGINDHFPISILLMCFLIKLLKKKIKRMSLCNILVLLIIKLLSNSIERDNKLTQHIKDCTKKYFFTIENIKASNCVSEQFLETNLCFLCISKIRCRNYCSFFQLLLLLSGDINPNPGPQDYESNKMWEPFVKRGLHFIHININSLLPKIDELRSIAQKSNAAVIGITESKLDESVLNSEIYIRQLQFDSM